MPEATKKQGVLEKLVLQLREANQNLVIASIHAQELQAQAEATNQRQKEFLSMLAHELRNPLAPITMANALLGKIAAGHPQLLKLHGVIGRQVSHMTHLVDDLVDASRVSSGKITLTIARIRLSEIIESSVEISQPFIDKRQQQLSIELPTAAVDVDGDLVRLAQAISNILINASKFTPEQGQITLSARTLAETIMVSIKDNGVGMAPELQPFIFDLFTQGPHALDRSQGGLGIGLSLVRNIAEMHNGSVQALSDGIGLGSEFILRLPIAAKALPHHDSPPVKPVPARHCRILLIEDNADANETLHDLLALAGHTVTCAFDGTTGLALASLNSYDVILCDIGLPGMDGYKVVTQLRRRAVTPMPVYIAMTGYNQPKFRTRAIEAGFDHYLVKPIAIEVLVQLIAAGAPA